MAICELSDPLGRAVMERELMVRVQGEIVPLLEGHTNIAEARDLA